MELSLIENKLLKENCSHADVKAMLTTILANIKAFAYVNKPIEDLVFYAVLKNTGGYKLFKTVNGKIVVDKLDDSYSESRELVCISAWNIKKAFKVTLEQSKGVGVKEINYKDMHSVLFELVEPTSVKYVVDSEEDSLPLALTVDHDMYKGLTYEGLKNILFASYEHGLNQAKGQIKTDKVLSYYVVSYIVSK